MISDAALDDLRRRNPVADIAGKWVSLRHRAGSKAGWLVGPCPLHSTDAFAKDSTSFECDAERWVCAVCADGGDVIKLVEKREGLDFRGAVAWLGGAQEVDPAEQKRRDDEAAKKKARAEASAAKFREDERERCWAYWNEAAPAAGTLVQRYLTGPRGLPLDSPAILWSRLRFHPHMPYYGPRTTYMRADGSRGRDYPNLLHTGPAMLAPILGPDGRFAGLHITWLDMADDKGKLCLADPSTGEILPAKKVRGSMGGGRIELVRHAEPRRLVLGEGIETVLSVACALLALGRAEGVAFWSGIALGNIGGRAAETVKHPTLKDAAGRTRRVPGPVPDMNAPGIPIPASVEEVILLGDADSDRFTAETTLERARARFVAGTDWRRVRIVWPPDGRDFNDLLQVTHA